MANSQIDYSTFEPDWWDGVGVSAEAVKGGIEKAIQEAYGGTLSEANKKALADAAYQHHLAQNAMKASAAAAKEALQYADLPDSPLYKNATATAKAYESIAKSAMGEANQIMSNANAGSALATNLSRLASVLGPAINIAQLGTAMSTGDAYEVGKTAVTVLAGMAIGSLAASAMAAVGAPVLLATAASIVAGFAASKFWGWLWDNGGAESLGVKRGDDFSGASIGAGLASLLSALFGQAEGTVSPLILDLDGDGVETISVNAGIHFDHDGNGTSETTGWVGKDDGLLVWDRNGNGQIDNGSELFGNNSILSNGQRATNGFAALAELDSNHDGKIDANDSAFSTLQIWRDLNSDAKVDAGELLSLSAANIASLNTAYSNGSAIDPQGNKALQVGQYTDANGVIRSMNDIWFNADRLNTVDAAPVAVSGEIASLPNFAGLGNVKSLHQAMAKDGSGALVSLVQALKQDVYSAQSGDLIDQLIFKWTGADAYAANSRGEYLADGRKLYALEAFLSKSFIQGSGTNEGLPNPGPNSAEVLMQAYEKLRSHIVESFVFEIRLKPYFQAMNLTLTPSGFSFDFAAVTSVFNLAFEQAQGTARELVVIDLLHFRDMQDLKDRFPSSDLLADLVGRLSSAERADLFARVPNLKAGSSGDDRLVAENDKNYLLIAGAGNDELLGGNLHDRLEGGSGNDTLSGGAGNDVLDGGTGNDVLNGGTGADTYLFKLGDGRDTINEDNGYGSETDVVKFGEGIRASDITVTRVGVNLVLSHRNGQDQITLSNWFYANSGRYQVERFEFADGTMWTSATVTAPFLKQVGGEGDDVLTGLTAAFNQSLSGGTGNDTLIGGAGNDVLEGGTGNDVLNGGTGGDTYLFKLGDGRDTINEDNGYGSETDVLKFGEGILATDITATRVGVNLVLSHRNGQDQITLSNWFYATGGRYQVERVEFADGTVWTSAALSTQLLTQVGGDGDDVLTGVSAAFNQSLSGGAGNDTLNGGAGADVLEGGTGNDVLNGGAGGDTYLFKLGDGRDTINEDNGYGSETDVLKFGEGILASDITATRVGVNLVLSHRNGQDQVTLNNWFYASGGRYQVDRFEFADGTVWNSGALATTLLKQVGGDGDDVLTGVSAAFNQSLSGGAGNDTLNGGSGTDVLEGGTGNDILNGGAGGDIYLFKLGDGRDTLNEDNGYGSETDVVKFGEGIQASDITATRVGTSLVLSHRNGQDQITINNWFYATGGRYQVERFEFADGTVWTSAALTNLTLTQVGGEGDDVLTGVSAAFNQSLSGGAGNDTLNGGSGADVLEGGTGNDILNGGAGGDTYVFKLGDGRDTINEDNGYGSETDTVKFGAGIVAADITATRVGTSLVLSHRNGQDQITLSNWFAANSGRYQVERFEFADGTVWTSSALSTRLLDLQGGDGDDVLTGVSSAQSQVIRGGAGNDVITAGAGADLLEGGTGNDVLNGGAGGDLYLFDLGDGQDVINEDNGYGAEIDVLRFGEGIQASDLIASRMGINLVLSHRNGQDQVTLNNWFAANSGRYQVDRFEFADGTVWTSAALATTLLKQVGGDGDDVLTGVSAAFNQSLFGGAGNDTLNGGAGTDVLEGGTGNDVLNGGAGGDIYLFKLGDGRDTINEDNGYGSETDVVKFGEGILAADITATRVGINLVLSHRNGQDQVTLNNWFATTGGRYQVERFEFIDGTVWTSAALTTLTLTQVGGAGDDVLTGVSAAFNQSLSGGAGNDTLNGGSGADVLEGGTGNDILNGGAGGDTYLFKLGDGRDTINEDNVYGSETDILRFGAGILASDITATRVGTSLVLSHRNGQDQITLSNWFSTTGGRYQIERFEFSNGTVWTSTEVSKQLLELVGGDGDDVLTGVSSAQSQVIRGGAGNDVITAGAGADLLEGGTGNDVLNGGAGGDTYLFNLGDGRDTINEDNVYGSETDVLKFGEGILASDIIATRVGVNLVLSHRNGLDQVTLNSWFSVNSGRYQVDRFEFADGTVWTSAALATTLLKQVGGDGDDVLTGVSAAFNQSLSGGAGNDTLNGGSGTDVLDGGTGNDVLNGGAGGDIYLFKLGDGRDTINEDNVYGSETDILRFGEGILASDITVTRVGVNLVLSHRNGQDQVTLNNWFYANSGRYQVDRFEFADGTVWTSAALAASILKQVGGDGDDVLTGVSAAFNQSLSGGAGNDILNGGTGFDVLDGGTGNDVLNGGAGGDTYLFKLGDGRDTINEDNVYGSETDVLKFGEGILASDITATRVGVNLVLSHRNGQDQVTLNSWFSVNSGRYQVDRFEFADGTVWTSAALATSLLTQVGGEGDDVLTGVSAAFNQSLSGGAGNDTLNGGTGFDVLDGGTGNDVLNGGAGGDIYLFKLGDGRDTINEDNVYGSETDILKFGEGILASDITVTRVGVNLVLSHRNGQDQVTLNNWFYANSGRYQVDRFEFADGTVWTSATVAAPLLKLVGGDGDDVLTGVSAAFNQSLVGGAGNDTLTGGAGADVLEGGTGNDVLNGGAGGDTYLFKLGDGRDTINDDNVYGSETDILKFGEGILTSDFSVSRVGNSLVLNHRNGQDQLTLNNWFYTTGGRYRIERFEFADGSLLTSDQMTARASTAGNDTLTGSSTNDRLQGGKGNDLLQGGDGADIYVFAAGDGQDTINNFSATPDDTDVLSIEGISATNLWLSRDGNNLVIDVTGSDDRVTVKDWYLGSAQKIDVIQAGGASLYANAVDNLVNAMATFGAPAGGEINLTQSQREQLNTVIAANWH
ncbi:calcium-binding protein [Pseudomonas gingeri]|nr:calcium-binding protein [Pseudomonas gingeri]